VRLLFGRTVRHIYAELVLGRGRLFVSESRAGGTPTGDLSEFVASSKDTDHNGIG
jgi:hypothetical protein